MHHFVFSCFAVKIKNTSIRKFELDIEYEYDFLLYGIVSAEKAYRLAWQLNQLSPYNFERQEDYAIEFSGKPCQFFQYGFMHEENHTRYFLLANKDESTWLLPELKNFDYLLIIHGALDFFDEARLKADINKINTVQLIYPVDVNSIRSKQNLMYLI